MKILSNLESADSGSIEWGETIRIGYFAQECEIMDERQRVIDYIKDAAEYVRTSEGSVSASKMLERFFYLLPYAIYTNCEDFWWGKTKIIFVESLDAVS